MAETPQDEKQKIRKPGIFSRLRGNFIAGLIVIAPIGLTVWLIWSFVGWIDSWVLPFVPDAYHPDQVLKRFLGEESELSIRGVGVLLFLVFTMLVGWMGKGILGRSFLRFGEQMVDRMPVVRSIYNGLKQIAETVLSQRDTSFERACLVEYPRKGIWAIAFISTSAKGEIASGIPVQDDKISVFLPTTPNPTSGFLLFVPKADVIELNMSVEDAAKLVISAGLVYPNSQDPTVPAQELAAE